MSAWDLLTAASSLPSGTAWQHLNALDALVELQIFDTWEAILMPCLVAELDDADVTVELAQDVDTTLEPDLEVEEECPQ